MTYPRFREDRPFSIYKEINPQCHRPLGRAWLSAIHVHLRCRSASLPPPGSAGQAGWVARLPTHIAKRNGGLGALPQTPLGHFKISQTLNIRRKSHPMHFISRALTSSIQPAIFMPTAAYGRGNW